VDAPGARPHVGGMAARGDAKVTTDHEFIRDWFERRGGCPAARPRARGGSTVRIEFRDTAGQRAVVPIEWDEFFDWFERNKLAFQYKEDRDSARFIDRASVVRPRLQRPRRRARPARARR
jgi:hypothetical protein